MSRPADFRVYPAGPNDGGCNCRSVGPCFGQVSVISMPSGSNVSSEMRMCFEHLVQFQGKLSVAIAVYKHFEAK